MSLDYSPNLPIITHPNNYKTISNESIKEYNNMDNFFLTSNPRQSSFNIRSNKFRTSIKTKIFIESQNNENNKNLKLWKLKINIIKE